MTTTVTHTCKVLVAPAMNHMYQFDRAGESGKTERHGYEMIDPVCGMLANGDTGDGKLPSEEDAGGVCLRELAFEGYGGLKVLVTAGPTQETIDPVRFISNHSTGKMVCRQQRNAMLRGRSDTGYRQDGIRTADVCKTVPRNICKRYVSGGRRMCKRTGHYIVKVMAVADYTAAHTADEKN